MKQAEYLEKLKLLTFEGVLLRTAILARDCTYPTHRVKLVTYISSGISAEDVCEAYGEAHEFKETAREHVEDALEAYERNLDEEIKSFSFDGRFWTPEVEQLKGYREKYVYSEKLRKFLEEINFSSDPEGWKKENWNEISESLNIEGEEDYTLKDIEEEIRYELEEFEKYRKEQIELNIYSDFDEYHRDGELEDCGFLYKCETSGKYYIDRFTEDEYDDEVIRKSNMEELLEKSISDLESLGTERDLEELEGFEHSLEYFVNTIEDLGGGY